MSLVSAWFYVGTFLVILFAICGALGLGYVVWQLFWHLYDAHMENSTRIANARLDRAYSTGQFYVPFNMRDKKGIER